MPKPESIHSHLRTARLTSLTLACALVLTAFAGFFWFRALRPAVLPGGSVELTRLAQELAALEAREQQVAETIWAKELLAQHCGLRFDRFWDKLNHATDKWAVVTAFPLETLLPGKRRQLQLLPHGIEWYRPDPAGPGSDRLRWNRKEWQDWVGQVRDDGWELGPVEFRHNQFEVDGQGHPDRSVFSFVAHLVNRVEDRRLLLEGDLTAIWGPPREEMGEHVPVVQSIDASGVSLLKRAAPVPFERVFSRNVAPPLGSFFIDPLLLYDLDGDGFSEIILASSNVVFRRHPSGQYEARTLLRHWPGRIFTAVIADFDGDGNADFLCATFDGLLLFRGSSSGTFELPSEWVWRAEPRLRYGQVLTCGDVNGNGHLDVWLGQYRPPYERGQMPTPYHDANDGNPSWLLLNDGSGRFRDATEAAGLGPKRWRRSYSGSFVDLNGNGKLDLLVISDFAGIDLYANDGQGRFKDVTSSWIAEPRAFGMGHALADFNRDGLLDFLVLGMHCPAAQRLEHLNLSRPGLGDHGGIRSAMIEGNRLYLGRKEGGYVQSALNESIARTGWSWGCAVFDLDNGGWPDVYIVNGHETRQSVRDYEPEFWLHDIHVANSEEDVVRAAYFGAKFARTRGRGHSYGGYEKNRLYLNLEGQRFVEIGHLMGIGLEVDSRNVAADDLDGDGRVDLVFTTFETWPEERQTLQVYRNKLPSAKNWIGVRLREEGGGTSPVGAQVFLRHRDGVTFRPIVTGDSHRTQHATVVHFGLGRLEAVEQVEVRWADGRSRVLMNPPINRYHAVTAPAREGGAGEAAEGSAVR
jgi:enediyne biosynthesis protein E4